VRRINYLDALRAGAMVVVVTWHVTALWTGIIPLSESTTSAIQWPLTLSQWSLPMFFLMAGFFGGTLRAHWGAARFARNRLLRIGLPLAVCLVTVVPLTWVLFSKYLSIEVDLVRAGLLHLWFLYYVLLFYGLMVVFPHVPKAAWWRQQTEALLRSSMAVPALATLTLALLFAARLVPAAPLWAIPNLSLVAFYGSFFALGAVVQGSSNGMDLIGRRPGLSATLTLVALFPTVLLRSGPINAAPGTLVGSTQGWAWTAAFCVLAWSATFTVCGLARRFLSAESPAIRYVADSSYWIYLTHLPLVVLLIVLIKPLELPFWVAWPLVMAVLFTVLLITYELVVRHTLVGRILNGPRPRRQWGRPARTQARRGLPEGHSG